MSPEAITVLAELPPVATATTGFVVTPFVGRVVPPTVWRPAPGEIEAVVSVRVRDLLQPDARGESMEHSATWPEPRLMPYIEVRSDRLWGLTLRILEPLLPLLVAGEWDTEP